MPQQISRHHVDVAGRRVHYLRHGDGPPVVLLHESPRSSAALLPLLAAAPAGVTAFALDTPGNGLSEPLVLRGGAAGDANDYADALDATLTALGLPRAAVYGTHTGAAFGLALALRHPQRVAHLVLDGVSSFDGAERAGMLHGYLPEFHPASDGSHLAWLWTRVRDQGLFFPWHHRGTGARLWRAPASTAALHATAMDLLAAGDAYRAPYTAAIRFQADRELAGLRVPAVIAAREGDVLLPHLDRLPAPPPGVRIGRWPGQRAAWAAAVWAELQAGTEGLPDAPAAFDAALPATPLGDTLAGPPGRRIHWRGALGGGGGGGGAGGLPLVWLHPSPGGARGMDAAMHRAMAGALGDRPVLCPDLPGHGESDDFGDGEPEALLAALHEALQGFGLDRAELRGEGLGAELAAVLAARHPRRYGAEPAPQRGTVMPPAPVPPRADGGHLFAAWQHARDEAIRGPWWTRGPADRHDFGDALDLRAIHRRCIEFLKEAPSAAVLRDRWEGAESGRIRH